MSESGRIDTATTAYRLSVADNRGGTTLPTLKAVERMYVEAVLTHCQGNKMRAARILGIDRRTLYRHLERWEKRAK
jgi:DNA-binding NtrC family response regulator